MGAERDVNRLLNESGAVLIRQGNHLVYRLPNGRNFVKAKTTSDNARSEKNSLSDLKRQLGIVNSKETMQPTQTKVTATQPQPLPPNPPPPPPLISSPAIYIPVKGALSLSLKDRLEAAIHAEEAAQEVLLAKAQAHEKRVTLLKALIPYVEDPDTEATLQALLPLPEPPPVALPEPPPPPPQVITERVMVTQELVLAATQTFDRDFTTVEVADLMTGDRNVSLQERSRIRQTVCAAMNTLEQRGKVIKERQGYGRKPGLWRKVDLTHLRTVAAGVNGQSHESTE